MCVLNIEKILELFPITRFQPFLSNPQVKNFFF